MATPEKSGAPNCTSPEALQAESDEHALQFARALVKHPGKIAIGTVVVILCMLGITFLLGRATFTVQQAEDYFIVGETSSSRADALRAARAHLSGADREDTVSRTETTTYHQFLLLFKSKRNNVFNQDSLRDIQEVERRIRTTAEFAALCQVESAENRSCRDPVSPLPLFFRHADTNEPAWDGKDLVDIEAQVEAMQNPSVRDSYIFFFGNDVGESPPFRTKYTRSLFWLGSPLEGYASERDRQGDQRAKIREFLAKVKEVVLNNGNTDEIETFLVGAGVNDLEFTVLTNHDFMFATGSFLAVFALVWLHARSAFLASVGMAQILLAFPAAFFFYKVVFNFEYFGNIDILSIFILLGIGADNIFVFHDAWVQSAAFEFVDLESRMSYVFQRAARTMLATSLTTAAAFGATAVSEIMPIGSFGTFSAALVVLNYLLVIILYPSAVIIWHRRALRKAGDASRAKVTDGSLDIELQKASKASRSAVSVGKVDDVAAIRAVRERIDVHERPFGARKTRTEVTGASETTLRRVERFFHGPFFNFLKKYRIVILVAFLGLLVAAGFGVSQLKPISKQEVWFPDWYDYARGTALLQEEYATSSLSNLATVNLVWGLKGMNTASVTKFDQNDRGVLEWNAGFDAAPGEAQEYLLSVCSRLQSSSTVQFVEESLLCPMEVLSRARIAANLPFPVPENEFASEMKKVVQQNAGQLSPLVGFGLDGRVMFVSVEFRIPLLQFAEAALVEKYFDSWESFMRAENAAAENTAPSVAPGYQVSMITWEWMRTQQGLARNAVTGVIFSLALAFVVLVAATGNLYVGLIATLSISGIVVTVLAGMVVYGWEIGTIESIAAVILVGFSVDYVVHLGVAYVESTKASSELRVRDAVTDMGVSVLAGATTTFASSLFLWPCMIIFFFKFATLMATTITISMLWSNLFFLSLLSVLGPVGKQGQITFAACRRCARGARERSVEHASKPVG